MADYARNKKATFNYEILERFEAGLVLHGFEVKAIRAGKVSLEGAYIILRDGEAYLKGATISHYQEANTPDSYDPERERKLLLNKKEIAKLEKELNTAGLTIVPIRLYNKNQKIKLEIALVRGKKKADKREAIKKRDTKRVLDRLLKW
ncbi:SsrA-binding protein [bacterium]|nr:SsrA-binding protein [bacterium]